jgi:outer membrane protein TolC
MNESHDITIKRADRSRIGDMTQWLLIALVSTLLIGTGSGCTASHYRKSADKVADKLIKEKQDQLFGKAEGLSVERPSDILRRRLMIDQNLQHASSASLGTDKLEKISHWPESKYPSDGTASEDGIVIEAGKPVKLSLTQALQVAAMNSSDFQTQKENVFQKALDLNLQRHQYGFSLGGGGTYQYKANNTGGQTSSSDTANPSLSLTKTLTYGAKIITSVGFDIVNLLTAGLTSKTFVGDASVSIPLLRGAGSYIASEQLTQAERDLVYSLQSFENYKNSFAVQITQGYMNVLSQMDQVDNNAENYRNLITSANRTSRLSEAGRTTIVQVNQALTQKLSAKDRWISALANYKNQLDSFKTMLGLPVDADLELDRSELISLTNRASEIVAKAGADTSTPEKLMEPAKENASSLEMDESQAIKLALANRYDLKVLEGRVYDAQRAVVIKADALGTDLTINGTGHLAGTTEVSGGGQSTPRSRNYSGLLSLNLPLDRVAERNDYRKSYIAL